MPSQRAIVAAAILGAVLAGPPAHAAKPGASPELGPKAGAPPASTDMDAPGPTATQCAELFARYDANKDGKLTYAEYVAGAWGGIRFIQAPTEREVAGFKRRFLASAKQADRNHDGYLSKAEHLTMCQAGDGP